MRVAIVAPSGVPFVVGGAEKLWWGLLTAINQGTDHAAELIKLPTPEGTFWDLMESYRAFSQLDLRHFDLVISTKYPAWMIDHPNHLVYLQHKLRGLYDTYHLTGLPTTVGEVPRPVRRLLQWVDVSDHTRRDLATFFDALFDLRALSETDPDPFGFPGPVSRRIVHFLDAVALDPRSVRRYAAISANVVRRADYFPPGAEVKVIHHPSDLPRFESGLYDYVFTASRLTHSKRIDLLIKAFRRLRDPIELRIAGSGPAEPRLRELAGDDPRIRFLGRISDEEMIRQYAGALFVPFVPYDEDYGLITVEAMGSGKAVLTTTDAGGVNELVEPGVTGLSVPPEVGPLARAMAQLIEDRAATEQMGRRARDRVGSIGWSATVAALLAPPEPRCEARRRRRRVVVAVDFPVHPPRGGGQTRVYSLYRALTGWAEVTLVSLCNDPAVAGVKDFGGGLREVRVAKSAAHRRATEALERELSASTADIATMAHHQLTPDYGVTLGREAEGCDLLVASHPYLFPAIEEACPAARIWYEAHNVEYDMKSVVLAHALGRGADAWVARVRDTEQALCARAERVIVCAEQDAQRLSVLYGVDPERFLIAPNGVDTRAVSYVTGEERLAAAERLGFAERFVALFLGSWHQPNLEALKALITVSRACPWADFLVVGTLCGHSLARDLPSNVSCLGVLTEAELNALMSAAHVALNPVTSGSGTNLKMLHYAAAGLPILSTPFGNRGLAFEPGRHVLLAELADFPARLAELARQPREGMAEAARELVVRRYDWRTIARDMAAFV